MFSLKFSIILFTVLSFDSSFSQTTLRRKVMTRKMTASTYAEPEVKPNLVVEAVPSNHVQEESAFHFKQVIDDKMECPGLQTSMNGLMKDKTDCDIEVEVNDVNRKQNEVFCSHRMILSMRSITLRKLIEAEVMKTPPTVAKKPRIKLTMSVKAFQMVLQYIYTNRIDQFDMAEDLVDLHEAAKYLQIEELVEMIKEHMHNELPVKQLFHYYMEEEVKDRPMAKMLLQEISSRLEVDMKMWNEFGQSFCPASNKASLLHPGDGYDEPEMVIPKLVGGTGHQTTRKRVSKEYSSTSIQYAN